MPRDYSIEKNLPTAHQRKPQYTRGDAWIRAFLHKGQVAHIATVSDRQPFITPTSYYFDEPGHRIIFHSNITGRLRANIDHNARVCAEVSEMGRYLPSNVALEFSLQFRSVVVFGSARLLHDPEETRRALYGLIRKYFPESIRACAAAPAAVTRAPAGRGTRRRGPPRYSSPPGTRRRSGSRP